MSSHNRQPAEGIRREYHTSRWERERKACLNTYDHVDLYALYHDGRVAAAEVVHHIEPILERPELFHMSGNHFPCSATSHNMIHWRYDNEDASAVKAELRGYLKRYQDEVING